MDSKQELLNKIDDFRNFCISMSTGGHFDYKEYEDARNSLISEERLNGLLPNWILRNRYGSQFWSFIGQNRGTYKERRDFLNIEFALIAENVENHASKPTSISMKSLFMSDNTNEIEKVWSKVLQRKDADPEGSITAARSLVETTLKYILDERNETYTNKDDLMDLYKKVAKTLNLSPAGHDEQLFKKILSGITSIVQGFASLRNNYGDAHGKGKIHYAPGDRHVELTVNLSGTVCTFLIRTYNEQKTIIQS